MIGNEDDIQQREFTNSECARFTHLLALFFYSSGTSLEHVENIYLKEVLKMCLPTVDIPSKRQLGGKILTDLYTEVIKILQADGKIGCVGEELTSQVTDKIEATRHFGRKNAERVKQAKLNFLCKHHDALNESFGLIKVPPSRAAAKESDAKEN